MKLLHFIGSIDPETGGTYEGLVRTAETMVDMGVDVAVASLDPPGLFDAAIRDLPFSCYPLGGNKRSYYGYSAHVRAWLEQHASGFDAIIVHGLWQYHGHAVSRACRKLGLPYFVFSHGMLDPWFNRQYPLKRVKKQLYWWWREAAVVRYATSMLFTAEEEKRLAADSFWPYHCKSTVVGYGTSGPPVPRDALLAGFCQDRPEWGNHPYWLFIGRIQEKKGLDLLLQAYAVLKREREHIPHLVIAGTAHDPGYLKQLQNSYAQNGVFWIGHVSGVKKWQVLAAAEAMALISHQENFGIVVAEALSVGTPVLISNKVNIWREVLKGNSGLVEDDTLDGATRLLSAWANLDDRAKEAYRPACQQAFTQNFDIKTSTRNILNCIEQHAE